MRIAVIIFLLVWLLVVWIGVGYALRQGWRTFKRDWMGRLTRMPARVAHKNEGQVFLPEAHEFGQAYEVTFECRDGQLVTYDVPEHVFLNAYLGEEGILVRQGRRFLGFESPSGASESADDIYRRMVKR